MVSDDRVLSIDYGVLSGDDVLPPPEPYPGVPAVGLLEYGEALADLAVGGIEFFGAGVLVEHGGVWRVGGDTEGNTLGKPGRISNVIDVDLPVSRGDARSGNYGPGKEKHVTANKGVFHK